MNFANEILDSIEIMVKKAIDDKSTKIYTGVCKSVSSNGTCNLEINGKANTVKYYGGTPKSGDVYRVFIPSNNMSAAFIITPGGGGDTPITAVTSYNDLTDKPSVNSVTLSGNKTSADLGLYGTNNTPPYPVTSVNNKTGAITLTASDVGALSDDTTIPTVNDATLTIQKNGTSVGTFSANASSNKTVNITVPTNNDELTNGAGYITESALTTYAKTADVPTKTSDLTNDSGFITNAALTGYAKESDIPTKVSDLTNDSGYITDSALAPYAKTADLPTKTSDLTNDSGFITSSQAPVQSVDGATGAVVLNDVKYTEQTLTDAQKTQARANIGAGTSSFSGNYNDLSNKPTIPTVNNGVLTIQKNGTDVATFSANSSDNATANITVPTKTSDLTNDSNYITSSGAPVQSVNTKTGAVVLTQDDIGDGITYVRTHNDFTDALKQQININEDNIAMIDSDVGALETDVSKAKTDITALQTALNSKQDTVVGAASTVVDDNLTASKVVVSNASGKIVASSTPDYMLNRINKEAYLTWGGRNISGGYGPIDAAMIPTLGANRLAFMPVNGVTYEYSRDGGTTWETYDTSDTNKAALFCGINSANFVIGGQSETGVDKSNHLVRFTIETSTAKVYTILNKFAIFISSNGSSNCYCTIQGRTQTNFASGTDAWDAFANQVPISGWTGWNIINTVGIITYAYGSTQYRQLRFTFGAGTHDTTAGGGLRIISILGYGGVGWITPSNLASLGTIYTYDSSQNVNFPAAVTATRFNGKVAASNVEGLDYPVDSVNGKTGAVTLSASDVGAISTSDISQTLGTSTTKVPSEKAVSDALSSAGAGDMLKSTYDPDNTVADAGGIVDYVDANGGKIDTIKVNGTAQTITNKTVDISVPTNTNQLTNGAGFITSSQAPVQSVNGKTGAVSLSASDVGALPISGGTMSGVINMGGNKITNVATPTADTDAANKAYADAQKGVEVLTQSSQPTAQVNGDMWFQTT